MQSPIWYKMHCLNFYKILIKVTNWLSQKSKRQQILKCFLVLFINPNMIWITLWWWVGRVWKLVKVRDWMLKTCAVSCAFHDGNQLHLWKGGGDIRRRGSKTQCSRNARVGQLSGKTNTSDISLLLNWIIGAFHLTAFGLLLFQTKW